MKTEKKRTYNVYFKDALWQNKDFLVEHLSKEWRLLEKEYNRNERRKVLVQVAKVSGRKAGKAFLILLLLGGIITIASVAPNIFVAFGKTSGRRRFFNEPELRRQMKHFKRKKYIRVLQKKDQYTVELTKEGIRRTLPYAYQDFHILHNKGEWDGFWRVIFFDISERKRNVRDSVRRKLSDIGCYQLQKSVFLFPYDCEEEIKFLARVHNVVDDIRYMVAHHISLDKGIIKKHFFLPLSSKKE